MPDASESEQPNNPVLDAYNAATLKLGVATKVLEHITDHVEGCAPVELDGGSALLQVIYAAIYQLRDCQKEMDRLWTVIRLDQVQS